MEPASTALAGQFLPQIAACKPDGFPPGLKVLLCEGTTSAVTSTALHGLGYAVTHAHGVQHAVELLQEHSSHFDVVLVGVEELDSDLTSASAHAMFQAAAGSGTPLVLMCQQYSTSDVMTAVQAGAADILERPLSPSKLAMLWQHSVRASMTSSRSVGTRHSQHKHQHQHSQVAAEAAPSTQGKPSSPMCCGLLDDCLMDGLGGLELPPLVPSQLEFDPDSILISDLQASGPSTAALTAGSLDDLLLPASPSYSNAATVVAASLFRCNSEQQCSGATTFTAAGAAATELESCADASSAGPPHNCLKLGGRTSLRSMAAASGSSGGCDCRPAAFGSYLVGQPAIGCPVPCATPMHMMSSTASGQWGSAGWGGGSWGMNMNVGMPPLPGPLGSGMVWGMPVRNVAIAPGIVPPQQPTAGSGGASMAAPVSVASSSGAGCSNTAMLGSSGSCLNSNTAGQPQPAPSAGHAAVHAPAAATTAQQGSGGLPMQPMWPGMWHPTWSGMMCPPMCLSMWQQHPGMLVAQSGAAGQPSTGPSAAPGMLPGSNASTQQPQQQQSNTWAGMWPGNAMPQPFVAPAVPGQQL